MTTTTTTTTRAWRARVLAGWMRCAAAVLASACVGAAACGGEYGGAPHAGARAFVPSDRAWRLWYLAPPWVLGMVRATGVELAVPINADEIMSGGRAGPVIALAVEVAAGTTPAALLAARAAPLRAMGATARYEARPVAMAGGAMGLESAYFGGAGLARLAAVTLADGRVALLTFTSGGSIDTDGDVAQMIAEFEPRPPGM